MIVKHRHTTCNMKAILVFLFMLVTFLPEVKAQETDYKAYSLYVYNFMKYIDWPENNNQGDFVILVLGKSRIEKELRSLAVKKKIRGRNIIVKSIDSIDEIINCHIIYIAEDKSAVIKDLYSKINDRGILIVGEKEGLAKKGAALSFATLDNDELSFDINKRAIEEQKLKISGELVRLGEVVVK